MSVLKKVKKRATRREFRVKNQIKRTNRSGRFRVSVFRSNKDISVQIIDDANARTIVGMAASSLETATGDKTSRAHQLGVAVGKKAKEADVAQVVFDRGKYLYHGRVKALAEGLREGGLEF